MIIRMRKIRTKDSLPIPTMDQDKIQWFSQVDEAKLAAFFYLAYKDSVDDAGETPADWQGVLQDFKRYKYGPLLKNASLVMKNEVQEIVCAVVMGLDDDAPYIMALATRQADRGNHLAEQLLNLSLAEIADFYQHIICYVKEENHSAIKLFERMGFVAEPV